VVTVIARHTFINIISYKAQNPLTENDQALCSFAEIDQQFRGAYCPDDGSSFCETTQRNIPEYNHLHTRRHENLKYYLEVLLSINFTQHE
jgi:hypothetical protein